jgi:truncated hemoglobin YjbI
MPALEQLTSLFYSRVPGDPILAPVFANMSAEHPQHVAEFLAEAQALSAPSGLGSVPVAERPRARTAQRLHTSSFTLCAVVLCTCCATSSQTVNPCHCRI